MTISARARDGAVSRRVTRPTRRVVALTGLLAIVGTVLFALVLRSPPAPPQNLHIAWWVLAVLFGATEVWVFHLQFGREAKSISISEIPLVLGLFYTAPGPLMLGRVLGPAVVVVLWRRQTPLKAALNIVLFYANGAVAIATFRLLGAGSVADAPRTWAAAVVAATLSIAVDLCVLSLILRWYTGGGRKDGVTGSLAGLFIAAASSVIGIVSVLTLRLGPLATIPLVLAGAVLMVGYRSYSALADRHTSLERLFRFSRELNSAPATTEVLPAVLEQARQLMRAEVAEVLRFSGGAASSPAASLWRYDGERVVTDSDERTALSQRLVQSLIHDGEAVLLTHDQPTASAFLRSRGAGEAVVAPLTVEGETVGVLAVYDRLMAGVKA